MLVGKPELKIPPGIPRRRWEDNIRMNIRGIGWGDVKWMHLIYVRDQWRVLVTTVMSLRVP